MFKRNRCSVYEKRPMLCRVDDLYTKYPDLAPSREEWHAMNHKNCNVMKQAVEDEKFTAFKNAMAYGGFPLDDKVAGMTADIYEITKKKSTKVNFDELNKIVDRHFPKLTVNYVPVNAESLVKEKICGNTVSDCQSRGAVFKCNLKEPHECVSQIEK